jgi:5,6,7,8-tetrahydromethanopterin hydro-lyase
MNFLRRFADSHLARKFGARVAAAVRREARALPNARTALLRFDRALKHRGLNPGTTADLVVASLLAWRLVSIVDAEDTASTGETMAKAKTPAKKAARITKLMVGEALVGDGNEVAHIDLILGPRGSSAETAFCNALINQRQGINGLLAVVAPNLLAKPNTVMFNKVFIKGAKQAVQMFGPAQHAVATAVMDCVADGTIPASQADDLFIAVGVFIHWDAQDDKKIHDYNYEATKLSIKRAVAGEPKAADVVAQYKKVKHPFYAG